MRYRAVDAHDELHVSGESLVLLGGQVRRVSELGTAVRACAVEPVDVATLAARLQERFGAPPDGDLHEHTRRAAEALVEAGLLERVED